MRSLAAIGIPFGVLAIVGVLLSRSVIGPGYETQVNRAIVTDETDEIVLDASIVNFSQTVGSNAQAFWIEVEIKNNSRRTVVVNKYLSYFDTRVCRLFGADASRSYVVEDLSIGPSDVSIYRRLRPGESIRVTHDWPAPVRRSIDGEWMINMVMYRLRLRSGFHTVSHWVCQEGELLSVVREGKEQSLSDAFTNCVCNVSFRTNPVIFEVK